MRKLLRATLILGFCAFSLSAVAQTAADGSLPDQNLTPGNARTVDPTDPVVCAQKGQQRSSTKTVRKDLTASAKMGVYRSYGMVSKQDKWCNTSEKCELDHLIPLSLGGSNDPKNLFPQKYEGYWNAHDKDRLETEFHKRVCHGRMDLIDAQTDMARDWIQAYKDTFNVSEPIQK